MLDIASDPARYCSRANLPVPDVVILKAMGEEAAVEAKEAPRQN